MKDNPVLTAFHNYYKTERGYHKRSVNSTGAWTATTPQAFFNFPLVTNVEEMNRPMLLIAGENAHSRYYSEDVAKAAGDIAELVIVPNADHVDLYDKVEKIPFDQLVSFFNQALS